ncbi:MAG: hypothetical protein QXT15_01335 [Desulfurococcaceae archaeon]
MACHPAAAEIKESIRNYAKSVVPGLFYTIDLYCCKLAGKDCVTILLEEPKTLRDILVRVYDLSPTVNLVARVFLYPVVIETNIDIPVEGLVSLFMNNPDELRRVLSDILCRK